MRFLVNIPKLPLKYHRDVFIILVAVLFFLGSRLGYALSFQDVTDLPLWPPSGIVFALIILLGRTAWPGITIGALISTLMAYWNNLELSQGSIITISCMIAIGQTLEILIGHLLVQHWIRDPYPFTKTVNTFRFLFVVALMCLAGAAFHALALQMNHVIPTGSYLSTAFTIWVASAVGILLFTPFILSIANVRKLNLTAPKVLEGLLLVVSLAGIFVLVQRYYDNHTLVRSLPYISIPILLWLAFRFNLTAAFTGVVAASLISFYFTIQHQGPFILEQTNDTMLLTQIFIGVISMSTIVLSSTVTERTQAQSELKSLNENLEARVKERTQALNDEITIRKGAEDTLLRTNEELSKRNTELDNFVYSVSHDLRAPIASVLGLTNLALKDRDQKMKNIYLERINTSALQQDNFIREILDQSRNSRLEVKKEEVYFESLIEETFNQLKFATTTGAAVQKSIRVNQSGVFYSDRWRLKVILNNILSNAIRYRNGKDPIVNIEVDVADHKATLAVEDNGRGIEKEHLEHVYQMFYRATDDGAGSGLGLYIVKETVDKLHGTVAIESKVGQGTKVIVEIPEIIEA
jgi:signal transduction histidine kinase